MLDKTELMVIFWWLFQICTTLSVSKSW